VHTAPTWWALLVLAGLAAFVAAGVLVVVVGDPVVGILGIVVFGGAGVPFARQVLARRPAVEVDHRGITDRASALAAGFVPWSQITDLGTWSHRGQTIVVIGVADPEAVLKRAGPVARRLMRANIGLCGSPVTVPTTVLPLTAEQLIDEMVAFRPYSSTRSRDALVSGCAPPSRTTSTSSIRTPPRPSR
jgi:hypothetical protein